MLFLPKKHIKIENSIIGFAPLVYNEWKIKNGIQDNFQDIQKKYGKSFDDIILALDFLFCIGKIDFNEEEGIRKI